MNESNKTKQKGKKKSNYCSGNRIYISRSNGASPYYFCDYLNNTIHSPKMEC